MWRLTLFKRKRQGFALVFVILIALAMIIPAMMIASSTAPRRKAVTGEAISDRVLAVGDATVDKILAKINTFPKVAQTDSTLNGGIAHINAYYASNPPGDDSKRPQKVAVKYGMSYLLSMLNGGNVPADPTKEKDGSTTEDPYYRVGAGYKDSESNNQDLNYYQDAKTDMDTDKDWSGSIWDIEDNVSTYLYDIKNQEYYAVVKYNNDDGKYKITNVDATGINGDITSKPIERLATGDVKNGIAAWDSNYLTDNRWIEIDTNTQYVDDGTNKDGSTKFQIRATVYPVTNTEVSHIVRNILAEATLHQLYANGTSGGGSSSSSVDRVFQYAAWSGQGLIANGNINFKEGDIQSDGTYTEDFNGGSIYAYGDISLNGLVHVGGNVVTSQDESSDPVITNGVVQIDGDVLCGQTETLPDFESGTEDNVKNTAQNHGIYSGDFEATGSHDVNGLDVKYYIDENATLDGDSTVNFHPVDNDYTDSKKPKVDWYVNGDLILNGDNTLNFGDTPGIIWVNGNVTMNGKTVIEGSGTIVANKIVTFNGIQGIIYNDDNDLVSIISEGSQTNGGIVVNGNSQMDGIFYAPHSDIIFNGLAKVFGTAVAGGWIYNNGFNNTFIYDKRLSSSSSTTPIPPIPSGSTVVEGVDFHTNNVYRFSWREIIADPVTNSNIQNLNPEFHYNP